MFDPVWGNQNDAKVIALCAESLAMLLRFDLEVLYTPISGHSYPKSGFWHANCLTVLQCFGPLDYVGLKPCVVLLLMFYAFYDPFK